MPEGSLEHYRNVYGEIIILIMAALFELVDYVIVQTRCAVISYPFQCHNL